jgi:hypothetical protein
MLKDIVDIWILDFWEKKRSWECESVKWRSKKQVKVCLSEQRERKKESLQSTERGVVCKEM